MAINLLHWRCVCVGGEAAHDQPCLVDKAVACCHGYKKLVEPNELSAAVLKRTAIFFFERVGGGERKYAVLPWSLKTKRGRIFKRGKWSSPHVRGVFSWSRECLLRGAILTSWRWLLLLLLTAGLRKGGTPREQRCTAPLGHRGCLCAAGARAWPKRGSSAMLSQTARLLRSEWTLVHQKQGVALA